MTSGGVDDDDTVISKFRLNLEKSCHNAVSKAIEFDKLLTKSDYNFFPKLAQKYVFPWGKTLISSIFQNFTVSCLLNSDLYYKAHYKDLVYTFNEENTVG